jgi:hypothetical protein
MGGFKNGSKGRRVPKSSLLRAREIWAEGNVTIALAVFKACTGVCLLWDWRARQKNKLACKGNPWSTLSGWVVAVRYALSTSPALLPPVTRCPSACRSLLRLLLAPFAPSPQASPIIPEMAPCISVRICPGPHVSPTSCLAPFLTLSTMKGCLQLVFRGSSFPLSRRWLPLLSYTTAGVEWGCSATRNGGLTGSCCVWCVISVMRSEQCTCHRRRCESTWQPTF